MPDPITAEAALVFRRLFLRYTAIAFLHDTLAVFSRLTRTRWNSSSKKNPQPLSLMGISFRRRSSFSEDTANTEDNRIFGGTRESGTIRVALRAPLR